MLQRNLWLSRICFAPDGGDGGGGGDGGAGGDKGGGGAPGGDKGGGDGGAGGDKGGGGADWRAGIAPEYKDLHQVKTAKDINDVLKWGVNSEKMVGADKLVLPGKDAKPEERDAALGAIFDKLGRPKEPTGYTFPEVKDRPYTDADKALQGAFAPVAHKLGLTQAQVDGVAKFQTDLAMKGIEAATKAAADNEAALRKQHGEQFDAKMEAGNKALDAALRSAGIDVNAFRQMKLADGSYVGDSMQTVGLFIAIGEMMGETAFNGGQGGGGAGGGFGAFASPKAAKAELDKLYSKDFLDPKHPYNDKRNTMHGQWTDRVMKLEAVANAAEK